MDTSETYIKMCEKAEEMQPAFPAWHMMETKACFFYDGSDVWYAYTMGEGKDMVLHKVWLPRQDQLQEMIKDPDGDFGDGLYFRGQGRYIRARALAYALCRFIGNHIRVDSMEQLWLAFCMSEKYNKYWDGEEWKEKQ